MGNALHFGAKAHEMMADTPGASFTSARAVEVDKIIDEIDGLDREILAVKK
ncbi:MAG: hypothetical protein IPN00_06250 [Hydrogenophilales bacterium]|nr:hypothetical protein [Hydrogenophilales bacterium]